MKKDLNIVMNGETLVLDQESMVEVRESRPAEMRTGSVMVAVSMEDLRRQTPIDSRSGRIGYVHVCEEGEELRQPQFKVGTYENGTFIPQTH